jgi:hypothetical protein
MYQLAARFSCGFVVSGLLSHELNTSVRGQTQAVSIYSKTCFCRMLVVFPLDSNILGFLDAISKFRLTSRDRNRPSSKYLIFRNVSASTFGIESSLSKSANPLRDSSPRMSKTVALPSCFAFINSPLPWGMRQYTPLPTCKPERGSASEIALLPSVCKNEFDADSLCKKIRRVLGPSKCTCCWRNSIWTFPRTHAIKISHEVISAVPRASDSYAASDRSSVIPKGPCLHSTLL